LYQILIAEDEALERKVLCSILQKHFGELCLIHQARSGPEAVALFMEHRPQVLILDIEMPGSTGLEAARQIRSSGLPCMILFLTAYDKFSYAREAIALRAVDYLLKPYEAQELILSVEEALNLYARTSGNPDLHLSFAQDPEDEEDPSSHRMGQVRENIERYIRKHYTSELSMQDVAKAMNYSEAYFCKLFKQCFKVNFSAWLNEFRVEKAKEMLLQSRMSIREISLACGYTDANYFARVFKRITGKTPSEFRLH
jgi:YesN/AraC family two-component response regulator